jgi:hypothetical protein
MPLIDIRQHGGKFGGGGYSIGSKIPSKRVTSLQVEKITSFPILSNLNIFDIYFFNGYFYVIGHDNSANKDTIIKYDKKGILIWSYNHPAPVKSHILYYYNGYLYFGSHLSSIVCKLNEVDGSYVYYTAPSNISNFYGYNGFFVVICSNQNVILLDSNLSVLHTLGTLYTPDDGSEQLIGYGNTFYLSSNGWSALEKFQIDVANKKLVKGWTNASPNRFWHLIAVNDSYVMVYAYGDRALRSYKTDDGTQPYGTTAYTYDAIYRNKTVTSGNYVCFIYKTTIRKIGFDCKELYSYDIGTGLCGILTDNGYLYVTANDKKLYKYKLAGDNLMWGFSYENNIGADVLAIDDDGVVWLRDNAYSGGVSTDKIHLVRDYYQVLR